MKPHITTAEFTQRFTELVVKGSGFPKKPHDRHIVFISVLIGIERERVYTNREFNALMKGWAWRFGDALGLDHVTLRRYLVDEYYVYRDAAGMQYEMELTAAPYTFDEAILSLDLDALVRAELEVRRLRRARYREEIMKDE